MTDSPEVLLSLYETMRSIRSFEKVVAQLHRAGQAPGLIHLYSGQEAVAAGACGALNTDDYIASHHRGHGHCLAKGSDPVHLFAEILGRKSKYGNGRGGSMHIFDPATGNLGTNGIVGGGIPLATGAALSAKLEKGTRVAIAFFGDGALNQGILFESMNMAAVWSLPVVYICENNGYGEFTEIDAVTAGHPYTRRGETFEIPSYRVDGMDVLSVFDAVTAAASRARRGDGPTFLVCDTYRFSGHHVGDEQTYKDTEERRLWEARDPIPLLRNVMIETGVAESSDIDTIDSKVEKAILAAAEQAKAVPFPDSQELEYYLYAD